GTGIISRRTAVPATTSANGSSAGGGAAGVAADDGREAHDAARSRNASAPRWRGRAAGGRLRRSNAAPRSSLESSATMRVSMMMLTSIPAAILAAFPCVEPKLERREFNRLLMGVRARIVVFAAAESDPEKGARAAFDRIAALEDAMTDWREDGEASRLAVRA